MAQKKPRPEVVVLPNGDLYSGAYITRVLAPDEAANVQAKAETLAANPIGSLKRCRDSSIAKLQGFIVSPERAKELCSDFGIALNETPEVAALETDEGIVFVAVPPNAPPEIRDHLELIAIVDQLIPLAESGGSFMEVLGLGMAFGKTLERLQIRDAEAIVLREWKREGKQQASGRDQWGLDEATISETKRLVAEAMAGGLKYHPACDAVAKQLGVTKITVLRRCPNPKR